MTTSNGQKTSTGPDSGKKNGKTNQVSKGYKPDRVGLERTKSIMHINDMMERAPSSTIFEVEQILEGMLKNNC